MVSEINGLVHECLSQGEDDGWQVKKWRAKRGRPERSKFTYQGSNHTRPTARSPPLRRKPQDVGNALSNVFVNKGT